jgi:hypothetical protein
MRSPLPRAVLLLALPLASGLLAPAARAEELPFDWVAHVQGKAPRILTLRGLGQALVQASKQELMEPGSGELTTLRQMSEERVVRQEAKALGVAVTDADVDARSREVDAAVRAKTNGKETLRDVIYKQLRSNLPEFRLGLRHLILKERIAAHPKHLGPSLLRQSEERRLAQVQVVVTTLLERARIEYGVATALQPEPKPLGAGVIATVNGEPITGEEFGLDLARRLPVDDVKRVLDHEVRSVLTEGTALSEEEMGATIEEERKNWNEWRELSTQEAWKSVSFDDYVKARWRISLEDLRRSRYYRGYFGLVRAVRGEVTPEAVAKEFQDEREGLYGESVRVTDVNVGFVQKNQFTRSDLRDRKEALRAANEILVQKESGVPFDQIVRGVNAKQDRSFTASQRRLRNTDADRILFDRAKSMRDGEVAVVETISAVHVLRREARLPPPSFEEVRGMIQEGLVRQRAEAWLAERVRDESLVKVRWPVPEEVWAATLR